MRLLAIYIRKLGNIFDNICFNFSSDFEVNYEDNILKIKELDEIHHNFYGNEIIDISVLIGKNGTGKTTLLDVIGNPMTERIYSLNMDRDGIKDSYFMLFELKTKIFYLEQIGTFHFHNIEGISSANSIDAFLFEKQSNNYVVVNADNPNERINYLSEDKPGFHNLSIYISRNEINHKFVPRCKERMIKLADWYKIYVDLFKKKMIHSPEVEMRFYVNDNRFKGLSESHFSIQSEIKEATVSLGNGILYTTEIFNDFMSNHINIVTRIFLNVLLKSKNGQNQEIIFSFMNLYTNKIIKWDHQTVKSLFYKLYQLFENKISFSTFEAEKQSTCLHLINAYEDFFLSILDAKKFINTGIDQFSIQMSGNTQNASILKLCKAYDKLQNIYLTLTEWWNKSEERTYDDIDIYYGTSLHLFTIDQAYDNVTPGISAGEKKLIDIISNITSEIHRNIDIMPIYNFRQEKIFLFLIDEVEKEMHPEWSRQFIHYLQKYLSQYKYKWNGTNYSLQDLNIKMQFIMSTHSPFLVSDLLEKSIIKLKKENNGKVIQVRHKEKSFAQNIQRIITNDFFVDGYFGRFAEEKVQNLIQLLNGQTECSEDQKENMLPEINEIGEPIIRDKLLQMYNEKFGMKQKMELSNLIKKIYGDDIEIDIKELEKILKRRSV